MFEELVGTINDFRCWQLKRFSDLPVSQMNGEWENEYDDWGKIYQSFRNVLSSVDPGLANDALLDEMIYVIARDNECEILIDELIQYPRWFEVLCKRSLQTGEADAKWQFADRLPQCECRPEVMDMIWAFANDSHEYVRRRARARISEMKKIKVRCIWEHNGSDSLIYSADFIGAFTRGGSKDIAKAKMRREINAYLRWKNGEDTGISDVEVEIIQDQPSELNIADADSDVLFETEKAPLSMEEYRELKTLALKSAADFLTLYESIPDKDVSVKPDRRTFYGAVPRTARDMYEHTKSVNSYYFGEINVDADNEGTILECRERGFETLEKQEDFLSDPVIEGSYGELWTLRKVLRRFIWHDRIHAKAMGRMADKAFPEDAIENRFFFRG